MNFFIILTHIAILIIVNQDKITQTDTLMDTQTDIILLRIHTTIIITILNNILNKTLIGKTITTISIGDIIIFLASY